MQYSFFSWDECSPCYDCIVKDFPQGLSPRQLLVLADDDVTDNAACNNFDIEEFQSYHRSFRVEGEVWVMDALFSNDAIVRIYYSEGDPRLAKDLCKKEYREFVKKEDGIL